MDDLKPSEKCKRVGLISLKDMAREVNKSVQTLNNWNKDNPQLFDYLLLGVAVQRLFRDRDLQEAIKLSIEKEKIEQQIKTATMSKTVVYHNLRDYNNKFFKAAIIGASDASPHDAKLDFVGHHDKLHLFRREDKVIAGDDLKLKHVLAGKRHGTITSPAWRYLYFPHISEFNDKGELDETAICTD